MGWGENLDGHVGNGTTSNGELTPVAVTGLTGATANKMLRTSVLKYKATAGHQAVEAFEGQPKDILESTLTGGPFVQSSWSLTTSVNNKEAIEVNSVV